MTNKVDAVKAKTSKKKVTKTRKGSVSEAKLCQLIERFNGNYSSVARELEITRHAVSKRVRESESLTAIANDTKQSIVDDAVQGLRELVGQREWPAIKHVLESESAKDAGFVPVDKKSTIEVKEVTTQLISVSSVSPDGKRVKLG